MKKIQSFLNLSLTEKKIFFKAFFLSAYVRFFTLYLPMRWWYKMFMGEQIQDMFQQQRIENKQNEIIKIHKTRQMVKLACRYAPWQAKCLVESILLKKLIKNSELPIYLGLNKFEGKYFAHAWISVKHSINCNYKVVSVHI